MGFKRALLLLALAAALSGVPAHATPTQHDAGATASKTCPAGFVHAYLSWGEKCLRAGEFCKVGNAEYRRYGFACPLSGHLTYGTRTTKPAPSSRPAVSSHPAGVTAKCRDGTYSYSTSRSGTCSHHGGVAVWY
jgi:Protein of unknown function (DUF3761)